SGGEGGALSLDPQAARRAHTVLSELAKLVGSSQPVPLELIAAQPGVLRNRDVAKDAAGEWARLSPVVEQALAACAASRDTEGRLLSQDVAQRLDAIERLVGTIAAEAKDAPVQWEKRLSERL